MLSRREMGALCAALLLCFLLSLGAAQKEGYVSDSDGGVTVVLDTNLTPELIEEGMVREIISKLQTMRKEADFEVTDRIHVTYSGSDKVGEIF